MKIAIEIFTTVIVVTLACILFASIISGNNQNAAARDFYNVVINRIEDSNCSNKVIEECTKEADEKGYKLSVEYMTVYVERPSKLVTLSYKISIPIFSLFGSDYRKEAIIEGYAR